MHKNNSRKSLELYYLSHKKYTPKISNKIRENPKDILEYDEPKQINYLEFLKRYLETSRNQEIRLCS
jgi:predicted house-cleaning noncanonical NTP pyrophosphatase (MazG superfamily)